MSTFLPHRRLATVLGAVITVALLASACQASADTTAFAVSDGEPEAAGATPAPSPVTTESAVATPAPANQPTPTTPPVTSTATAVPAPTVAEQTQPLLLTLSVHVEGYLGEPDLDEAGQEVIYRNHRMAVMRVAESATANGAVVSFEVSSLFVARVAAHEPTFLLDLIAMGHDVEVHADLGGASTLPLAAFANQLRQKRTALQELVGDKPVTHVSGICSRGPWIEAAIDAGFTSANGAVAYCMTSLDADERPPGTDWVADCESPAQCHGPMTVTPHQRVFPFLVDDSRNFLSGAAPEMVDRSLVLIVSEAASSVSCVADGEDVARCVLEADDVARIQSVLDEYLEIVPTTRNAGDGPAVLSYSWSVGASPDPAAVDALFAMFGQYVSSGQAQWMSSGDVGALIAAAAGADS